MPPSRLTSALRAVIGALAIAALAACSPGSSLPPMPDYDGTTYRLGVGDQVRLLTFGVEQLTGTFRINDAGDIDLPIIGAFHAAGKSTRDLKAALARELEQKRILRDPILSVEVTEYRPIFVLGEVNRPGQYPYQPGMKMLTAVAVAGGFTYRAVQERVQVLRSVDSTAETGQARLDAFVAPADVITVLERYF